jgi:MFS family permease
VTPTAPEQTAPLHNYRVIGLICAAHFFSHFYLLILPALLPVLTTVYGVGFTELGIAISVHSIATGALQAPVGFLVDRYGARQFLIAAVLLTSASFVAIGFTSSYVMLLVLMGVAGAANSIFHPADYALLNAAVPSNLAGRAFSLHSFSAQLGNAAGPLTVLALLMVMDFPMAMVVCGGAGIVVGLVLIAFSGSLRPTSTITSKPPGAGPDEKPRRSGLALLLSAPILLGFVFFALSAINHRGITGFGVSGVHLLHGVTLGDAGIALGGYLLGAPIGVLFGGWLADRTARHARVAMSMFAAIALCLALLASYDLHALVSAALFFVIGFAQGTATPSRDMIVRAVTPPGEVGKVFGFVSSGLNLGGVLTPPLFGYLLDSGDPAMVFWVLCAVAIITIAVGAFSGGAGRGVRGRAG